MNKPTQLLFKTLINDKLFREYVLDNLSSEGNESISLFSENNLYNWCRSKYDELSDNIQWTELTFQLLGYKYPSLWNTPLFGQTIVINKLLENEFKQKFMSCKTNASKDKHSYFNEYRLRKFLQNHHLNTSDICYNHLVYYHYKLMAEHKQNEVNETYIGVKFSGSSKMYFYKAGKHIIQKGDFVTVNAAGVIKKVKVLRIETDYKPNQFIEYKTIISVEPHEKIISTKASLIIIDEVIDTQQTEKQILNQFAINELKGATTRRFIKENSTEIKAKSFMDTIRMSSREEAFKKEYLLIPKIEMETCKSHIADAYAYIANQIVNATTTGRIKSKGLTLSNLPKQKKKTMDNNANVTQAAQEIHTYENEHYEKREFYKGQDLTFLSDEYLIDTILNLQDKVNQLKKLARRLNSDKIRTQHKYAKTDLKALKDYFESR